MENMFFPYVDTVNFFFLPKKGINKPPFTDCDSVP